MLYKSYFNSKQNDELTIGVLITNLGSPEAATRKALRPYLKEFLSDPRIVEEPPSRWWWLLVLNSVILNIRPAKSAKSYQTIWDAEGSGSPLLSISRKQVAAIEKQVKLRFKGRIEFEMAMRYGNPSIASALQKLQAKGCHKVLVFPLYPQYAGATTASTMDAVMTEFKSWRCLPELRTINQYYRHNGYIKALANSIETYQIKHGKPDLLVISFHGIPQRYFDNGDPYITQCYETAKLVAAHLGLNQKSYKVTFQSRFGRDPWVKPYTDKILKDLPAQGIKSIQVICPGFSADCLETIEEIAEENREYFEDAGGEKFGYIRCLNDAEDHVLALSDLVLQHLKGWDLEEDKLGCLSQ